MILKNTHQVVDCPICGRPLEIEMQFVSQEIACGHCRGEFSVYETDDNSLTATYREGLDLLKRAEELLHATSYTGTSTVNCRFQRPHMSESLFDGKERPDEPRLSLLEEAECQAETLPTIVLVEHRDEVFARIATDMAEFGMRVIRARSATEAIKMCGAYKPVLVVANVDLPDQTGWLLAGKLRFVDRNIRTWLYQAQSSNYDLETVNFLNVHEVLDYDGDLLGLSETIIDLMNDWREPKSGNSDMKEVAAV